MSRTIPAPWALLALGGCMFGPYNGQTVPSPSSSVSAWGAYNAASAPITVEARSPVDGQFYAIASTTSTTGYYTAFATNWYWWTVSTSVPTAYWRPGVVGQRAELRARSGTTYLSSYPADGLSCMLDESAAGTYVLDAQERCAASPTGFLYTADYRGLPTFTPQAPEDHPRELQTGHTEEIQGAASTSSHWYFTRNNDPTVVRVPLTADLADDTPWDDAIAAGMPETLEALGYDHFGDPDEHGGSVYVPLEGAAIGAIAQFDLDLNFRGHALLVGPSAAWVAIDPTSGLLYSSPFCDASEVDVYTMTFAPDGTLTGLGLTDRRPLWDGNGVPLTVQSVQGGAFSDRGNLYLASDADSDHSCVGGVSGVYGFEGATLRKEAWFPVTYDPGDGEELEGIDIRDLSAAGVPGIAGQVHVVLLDNDWPDGDDLYFKHYGAPAAELGAL